jgi:cytochrome c
MSPMVAMVAEADPAAGEARFRQCAACHTVDQGGQNRVGPNLWDVFGADIGHHDGFNYSDALLALEGIWTVDKLDAYLEDPRAAAPGNRMAFAGLRSPEDRAAMIAYLRSLSDDPRPVDIQ